MMDDSTDLRDRVVAELHRRTGELRSIAVAAGLAYDTVLRIKNREGDPGYSKIKLLHEHLFQGAAADRAAA